MPPYFRPRPRGQQNSSASRTKPAVCKRVSQPTSWPRSRPACRHLRLHRPVRDSRGTPAWAHRALQPEHIRGKRMSQLQKRIQRLQRRDGPAMGFGRVVREQPRAMVLMALVANSKEAKAALDAGADAVLIEAASASAAASALNGVADEKVAASVLVGSLSEADAEALRKAKCDFV